MSQVGKEYFAARRIAT